MAFISDETARGLAEVMRQRVAAEPLLAEDWASIAESMPYVVHLYEGTPPIRCECCGTLVSMVPDAEASAVPWRFAPAIWEAGVVRKHTLRRCNWRRDQSETSKSSTQ